MTVDTQQRFIDLVNKDNSLTLTKNDVILGKVSDLPDGRSKTKILAVRGSGYRGGVTLHYQRLRFSKLFGFFQPKVEVPPGFEPTIPLFIAQVELRYGIRLKEDEVIISRKTTEEGDFYVVEARDTSLLYSDTQSLCWSSTRSKFRRWSTAAQRTSSTQPISQRTKCAASTRWYTLVAGWYPKPK